MAKALRIGLIVLMLLLCGCGKVQETPHAAADTLNEPVLVSEFTNLAVDLSEVEILRMDSSAFYYVAFEWDPEHQVMKASVYRTDLADRKTTLLADYGDEGLSVRFLLMDENQSIYLWAYEKADDTYLVRKYDSGNKLLWETKVDFSVAAGARQDYMLGGAVDGEGRLCLSDDLGQIYLFDALGNLQRLVNPDRGTLSALVIAEDGALAACYQKWNGGEQGNGMDYILIDPESGDMSGEGRIGLTGSGMPFVQGGNGNSLVYIDNGILWEWDFSAQEKNELADLSESYVSVDETMVRALSLSGQGVEGLLLYDEWFGSSEYAAFTYVERSLLPEKKTVTLGTTLDLNTEMLQQFVTRFNRQNKEWEVEIVEYFSYMSPHDNFLDEFTKDILDGSAPDLIDVRSMPVNLLADKGLFEDLTPYFKQSNAVSKKDILDSVWEAGVYDREMQFVMPWFSLSSYVIKEDNLSGKNWDLEEFVRLLNTERDNNILLYVSDNTEYRLLEYALYANMERFCDTESGTCDFTNDEFIGLLEAIHRRDDQRVPAQGGISDIEMWEQIASDEILLCFTNINSISYYNRTQQALGENFRWVGYPSGDGQHHSFNRFMMLGMNSGSGQKEGAWAFLEFLLSEEIQSWNSATMNVFPVREDAFERNISAAYSDNRGEQVTITKEEKKAFKELAENAYIHPYRIYDPMYNIVLEESAAYFAGDRTAEETARIIENRVQLYMDEMN